MTVKEIKKQMYQILLEKMDTNDFVSQIAANETVINILIDKTIELYQIGYDEGYKKGLSEHQDRSYENGYEEGYEEGYNTLCIDEYHNGYDNGYQAEYEEGYDVGI